MRKTLQQTARPPLAFACVWCGKPIVVTRSRDAEEILDAKAFLETHGDCLRRMQQASGRRPNVIQLPP